MQKENSKLIVGIIIGIAIALVIGYAVFVYMPNLEKNKEIENYKKTVFNSLLCQYSCSLADVTYRNITQLLPNTACVKNCTLTAKKEINNTELSSKELENDNFFRDMQITLTLCQNQTKINSTFVNNSAYFACVPEKLELLKETYSYLN